MKKEKKYISLIGLIAITILIFSVGSCGSSGNTLINVSPLSSLVSQGETFIVDVMISPTEEIAGWQFNLRYNSSLIKANYVEEGGLFKDAGYDTLFSDGTIDNTNGTIASVYCSILGNHNVTSTGTAAKISFTASDSYIGTTPCDLITIHPISVLISSPEGNAILPNITNGTIEVTLKEENKTIKFYDTSLGGQDAKVENWLWEFYYYNKTFMDSKVTQNVTYTFPNYGKYYVNLTVINECGNYNSTGLVCIDTGCPIPIASFKHTAISC